MTSSLSAETYDQSDSIHAFDAVSLANFALSASGAHLFRAQHEHLLRMLDDALSLVAGSSLGDGVSTSSGEVIEARKRVTRFCAMLALHRKFETELFLGSLASDPRTRMLIEHAEREMVSVAGQAAALARAYPTPSSIAADVAGFTQATQVLHDKLATCFASEERELFVVFDRASAQSTRRSASAESA